MIKTCTKIIHRNFLFFQFNFKKLKKLLVENYISLPFIEKTNLSGSKFYFYSLNILYNFIHEYNFYMLIYNHPALPCSVLIFWNESKICMILTLIRLCLKYVPTDCVKLGLKNRYSVVKRLKMTVMGNRLGICFLWLCNFSSKMYISTVKITVLSRNYYFFFHRNPKWNSFISNYLY